MKPEDIRRNVKKATAQEKKTMEALGGKRHGGSGATWSRKADGRVNASSWLAPGHAIVECKRTDKKSISIKSEDLEKVFVEAVMEGRIPLLSIELNNKRYILMEEDDYVEMGLSRSD